ncbi:MAG: hypothetical protein OZ913_06470 [Ignavibacteriaceae bacterium]|nr:hypothetical protein [Ignavibacteria bacterium]MCC6885410.1 hypothetical protein [Ignavibacteriales bacterium]MDL1887458.1 hypothetical protein [Ignavibacteria bacterium CHB1]MEB2329931.1 hypothetical protein [Ignavibacteriaceae bacterium]
MRLLTSSFIVAIIVMSIYSCNNNSDPVSPTTQRCDKTLGFGRNGLSNLPADSFTVSYKLSITGNVGIESYRYQTPGGPVDVTGITSPHTLDTSFFFASGDTAFLNYKTEITSGSVAGSVKVTKTNVSMLDTTSCQYSSN